MTPLATQGDTLAVDGAGWIAKLMEGERVDHGGDYDSLHETTLREVARLLDLGLRLRVFKSGANVWMRRVREALRTEPLERVFADGRGVLFCSPRTRTACGVITSFPPFERWVNIVGVS